MYYREMTIKDHPAMVKLWRASSGVSLRRADAVDGIARYLARNTALSFVAEQDQTIIGTIMAGHDGKRGYIQHLAVHKDFRRQGIATELLRFCLKALKQDGIVKSHVHILNDNQSGQKFWRNHDWFQRQEIVMYSFVNDDDSNA